MKPSALPADARPTSQGGGLPVWKLEDAKSRFSELVRLAREGGGPQKVTVRGQDAVVVLSATDYARLAPSASRPTLAALFADGPFGQLPTFDETPMRERSPVRDPVVF